MISRQSILAAAETIQTTNKADMMKPLLSYRQSAKIMGMSKKTLQKLVAERKISCIRYSHTLVKFKEEDVLRFIAEHYQPALED